MILKYELIIRVIVGGILGGIIGFEREKRAKEAGFRTHFLVALGSTLITVISAYGFDKVADLIPIARYDPARLAAQIVSGIGFIGAGLIIFQKNVIHGLTTAAGLWVTAAIGIACGVGHYELAVITTIMVLIALELALAVDDKLNKRQLSITMTSADKEKIKSIVDSVKADGVVIRSYDLELLDEGQGKTYKATVELSTKRIDYEEHVWDLLDGMDGSIVSHKK
ncbi:MAG: MgtC/SapB family protein [Bacteroidales bacterium]|nr:MgtC/SapB family protein [Bacteroidales bacterium]MBO7479708.1 MgtC/SapB family protein [Bacteroidales bacterium]MBO7487655.1 MgtC/SapB family protein [Bacteroidales bacterium]